MRKLTYFAAALVAAAFSVPTISAKADGFRYKMTCEDAARLQHSKHRVNRESARKLLASPECQQPVYKAPPMVQDIPQVFACGGSGSMAGIFGGSGIRVGVYGGGAVTRKDMNDESKGVDKSVLTFYSPVIGASLCVPMTERVALDFSVDHMFKGKKVKRTYTTGWTETDELSLTTFRFGPTYRVSQQLAVGAHGLVSWGKMDYSQDLLWFGKSYHQSGTVDGTFVGGGGSVKWNFTESLYVKGTGEYAKLISDVPAGANKTSYIKGMLTLGWEF